MISMQNTDDGNPCRRDGMTGEWSELPTESPAKAFELFGELLHFIVVI